jgi:EmrB/QacA subfamily drug resistance transporter
MFSGESHARLLTLLATCFAMFMTMLDNTVVNVALPTLQRSFGSSVSGLQWIIGGYTLLFATFMLTGGTLGDIYGRRRAFLAGLGIFTAGSLLCGLAPSLGVLIGGRVVQGVGAALLVPGSLALLTNSFPEARERAQAIGLWAGVSGVALAMGPVVGGLLVDSLGWQSVFFLNVPIGITAFGVTTHAVRESKHPEGRGLDLAGQTLAIVSLGSVTYALIEAENQGWTSVATIGLFLAAGASVAAFLQVERRSRSPMLQLGFFRDKTFSASVAVAGLVSFGMFGALFFLTLYIQNVQGYSALGMGVRALPLTSAVIVTAPLAGRLAARVGSRLPMTAGLLMNGAGLLLLERITPTMSYAMLWWNLVLLGVGMGLVATPMTAAVMSAVPRARAGMASATTNASREIGGVLGVALLGALVSHWFTVQLAAGMSAFALPADAKSRLLALASHGRVSAAALLTHGEARSLHSVVASAYVAGMRPAIAVAGATLLLGSGLALAFVRGGAPAAASLPTTEQAAAPEAETAAAAESLGGPATAGGRTTTASGRANAKEEAA